MAKGKELSNEQREDAARLRKIWAEKKPMTQERFAAEYGLGTQGNLTQYLNGHIPVNLEAAIRFANGLGVSVEDISPRLAKITAMLPRSMSAPQLPLQVEVLVERVMAITPEQRQEFLNAVLPQLGAAIDANLKTQQFLKDKLKRIKTVGNDHIERAFGTPSKPAKKKEKSKSSPGRPPDAQMDDIPEK